MSPKSISDCRFPDLIPRYATALRAAVAFILEQHEPRGILAAGSIVRGYPDVTSDLDMFVIHDAPYRQRRQRWFGDVPAEIFVNPAKSVRAYFIEEDAEGRPSTAHMVATGFVVLGDPEIDSLKREATEWLSKKTPLTLEQSVAARYSAATLFEDAEDVASRDPAMASALLGEAVMAIVRFYLRSKNGVLPGTKYLFADLETMEPEVARLVRQFFEPRPFDERIRVARTIADQCIGVRGFFEWDGERIPVE